MVVLPAIDIVEKIFDYKVKISSQAAFCKPLRRNFVFMII